MVRCWVSHFCEGVVCDVCRLHPRTTVILSYSIGILPANTAGEGKGLWVAEGWLGSLCSQLAGLLEWRDSVAFRGAG